MDTLRLIVVKGRTDKKTVVVDQFPYSIGRSHEASLPVSHKQVSRQHCELDLREEGVCVRDLGSANGTQVDGREIDEVLLHSGQMLTVGPLTFQVELEESQATTDEKPRAPEPAETAEAEEPEESTDVLAPPGPGTSGVMDLTESDLSDSEYEMDVLGDFDSQIEEGSSVYLQPGEYEEVPDFKKADLADPQTKSPNRKPPVRRDPPSSISSVQTRPNAPPGSSVDKRVPPVRRDPPSSVSSVREAEEIIEKVTGKSIHEVEQDRSHLDRRDWQKSGISYDNLLAMKDGDSFAIRLRTANAEGIEAESPVRVAGVRVGNVVEVTWSEFQGRLCAEVILTIEKKLGMVLRKDAQIRIHRDRDPAVIELVSPGHDAAKIELGGVIVLDDLKQSVE